MNQTGLVLHACDLTGAIVGVRDNIGVSGTVRVGFGAHKQIAVERRTAGRGDAISPLGLLILDTGRGVVPGLEHRDVAVGVVLVNRLAVDGRMGASGHPTHQLFNEATSGVPCPGGDGQHGVGRLEWLPFGIKGRQIHQHVIRARGNERSPCPCQIAIGAVVRRGHGAADGIRITGNVAHSRLRLGGPIVL